MKKFVNTLIGIAVIAFLIFMVRGCNNLLFNPTKYSELTVYTSANAHKLKAPEGGYLIVGIDEENISVGDQDGTLVFTCSNCYAKDFVKLEK